MAIIRRGQEPANIKKRLDTLFPKLNEAYPDKVIRSLARDHKKWAETVTELYRALGYPDSESFLKAYGYTVERAAATGRPSGDHMAIIDELKKRYPNGTSFEKMDELKDANPDLAGKFKTLSNRSKELFGMTLADYFKSIGLLGGSDHKKQLDDLIAELKHRYPAGSTLPVTLTQLKEDNADLMMSRLVYIKELYGSDLKEYLIKARLIKETDPASELETFVAMIRERYAGKLMPGTLDQLKNENSDLPFSNAAKWTEEVFGMSLATYLKKGKIIDLENRQLQAAEKAAASKPATDVLEFAGRAFVTTGLDDSQEEIIKDIVQSRGGFFRTAVSKNTDYLITHPSIPKWDITSKYKTAQSWIEKGVNIQIMPFSKFMNLAERYTQSPSEKTDFLITKGVLTRYLGQDNIVIIPDEVTEIGSKAFAGCCSVDEVRLSKNIKRINRSAFKDCTFLRKVFVDGNDWSNVDIQAFPQYASLPITFVGMPEFYINAGRLIGYFGTNSVVRIPNAVTTICEAAFKNKDVVEEIYLSNSVTTISNEAFAQCKNLRKIILPDSVTSIGSKAFAECKKMEAIVLPKKLSALGESAFEWCSSLQSIQFPDTIKDIPNSVCYGCTGIREIALGKKTKQIGEWAFANCQAITGISLPETVRKLSSCAFKDCKCLVSIVVPPAVKRLGAALFESCSALQKVELSPQLTHIEGSAFRECVSLSQVVVYEGLKSIGNYAFSIAST